MKGITKRITKCRPAALAVLAAALYAGGAAANEYWLCAASTTKTMPDGTIVTMWGYAADDNNNLIDGCGTGQVQVPGPLLTVPPAESSLIIHLANQLPAIGNAPVSTSLVLAGHVSRDPLAPMTPTFHPNGRVRSFTQETAPGAINTYTFTGLRPGSYAYHSGTHPAVQVQMGLYGGMRHDAVLGLAYPGVPYDSDLVLFYSEIDPALHQAVADGSYGTPAYPSTIGYRPRYFLVNGEPYQNGAAPITTRQTNQRLLMRFFNMGLETHVPVVHGLMLQAVAEDARPYAHPRRQYSLELPAGKSRDVIATPTRSGRFAIYDRSLDLTNGKQSPGGFYSLLAVNDGALPGILGSAAITHLWQSMALPAMQAPVVIAGTPTYNGTQPGTVRLRNVGAAGFDIHFEEWSYLDGVHIGEQADWLAVEPGRYMFSDGSVWEVGSFTLSGTGAWSRQSFGRSFDGTPALFLTVQTTNDPTPVTVRARGVTADGFDAAIFEEEAQMNGHAAERVGYLALYQPAGAGSLTIGAATTAYRVGSAKVDYNFVPVLSGLRQVKLEEEQSLDQETFHLKEDVAVMEMGSGLFAQDVSTIGRDTVAPRKR